MAIFQELLAKSSSCSYFVYLVEKSKKARFRLSNYWIRLQDTLSSHTQCTLSKKNGTVIFPLKRYPSIKQILGVKIQNLKLISKINVKKKFIEKKEDCLWNWSHSKLCRSFYFISHLWKSLVIFISHISFMSIVAVTSFRWFSILIGLRQTMIFPPSFIIFIR